MFLPLPFRPSWISSSPYPTLGGPLSIPLQPLRGPSSSLVALRGHVFAFAFSPFVDIFFPLPDPRRSLQPLRGPSSFLVALRGHVFAFAFSPFVDIFPPYPTLGEPLSIPLQPLRGPSSFLVALRGHVFAFAFSPFVDISFPLPDPRRTPSRSPSNPFVALRGFVDFFFWPLWITLNGFRQAGPYR